MVVRLFKEDGDKYPDDVGKGELQNNDSVE